MLIFDYDIFISRIPVTAQRRRKFINVERGWTKNDTEVLIGPWEIIISKLTEED